MSSAIDQLIISVITANRIATSQECTRMVDSVSQSPFATYLARVPTRLRSSLSAYGIVLPKKQPSVEQHLLKRIYDEKQWPVGTSIDRYISDLHQAIQHPDVKIWTYHYYNRPFASFMSPSHVIDAPNPLPYIYVVYDPQFGVITTGYQASGIETIFDENFTHIVHHK